jgi:cobalt-zinc-cadmium efflux system membrane fusion protein
MIRARAPRRRVRAVAATTAVGLACSLGLAGCQGRGAADDPAAGAPPPAVVDHVSDGSVVTVDHPEQFPLVAVTEHDAASELDVTGVVSPDVSRAVPVVSLASGRVVELRARLGDNVRQGQLLMRIQSPDVSAAFSDYRKAVTDEALTRAQLTRAKDLFDHGAIAKKDLEVAEDAENKSVVDVDTDAELLKALGADPSQAPTSVVDVVAPVTGVITEQNVTNAAGVKTLDNSPNLFTISDLSHVWIICDVYEHDVPTVHLEDTADVRLNAFPGRVLHGRVSNIGPALDPTIRTAKVRIEVANPGYMRLGMFVTATFHGAATQSFAVVPASAILHLHDREWVYVAAGSGRFQRVEVVSGEQLPGDLQEVRSGVRPGQRVVLKALVLQSTVEQ